jgi:hypothetical protein
MSKLSQYVGKFYFYINRLILLHFLSRWLRYLLQALTVSITSTYIALFCIIDANAYHLTYHPTLQKADAALILGYRTYLDGAANPCLTGRVDKGLLLTRQGLVSTLIMSGGRDNEDNSIEAEVMATYAKNQGYKGRILLESRSGDQLDDDDDEANGTRRKLYEHDFYFENRKAHMHFINGRQLEIDLALVKDINALALYGAEQKISDSYSGIKNDPEKRSAAERIIRNFYAGTWSSKKESTGSDSDRSALDTQVVNHLVEWMRWPVAATMIAVGHIDEQDKLRLTSDETKLLLVRYSRKLGMDDNPSKCNQRNIANLLDEVISRLIPMDD